jgi:hypothetical protein
MWFDIYPPIIRSNPSYLKNLMIHSFLKYLTNPMFHLSLMNLKYLMNRLFHQSLKNHLIRSILKIRLNHLILMCH